MQTCAYEAGGVVLAAPVYAAIFGASGMDATLLIVALAAACLVWAPIHNTLFDWIELRRTGRLASDRPHRWRLVHAFSTEASSVLVTLPLVMALGGHGFVAALVVDLGLTLLYTAYAYVFHLGFDRLRPVRPASNLPARPGRAGASPAAPGARSHDGRATRAGRRASAQPPAGMAPSRRIG
jgi:uncharacterized membrane protein